MLVLRRAGDDLLGGGPNGDHPEGEGGEGSLQGRGGAGMLLDRKHRKDRKDRIRRREDVRRGATRR